MLVVRTSLVVTGFFAPVEAAVFFAAGLALLMFFGGRLLRRLAADEPKPLVYQTFCRHDRFSFERLSSGVSKSSAEH